MISIDCSVLRTLTIYPHHSHIAGLKSRFYAHVGRVSRSCTPLCKHRRARTFRPYKHKKVPGRIFQTHRTKRDVRSTFIRLFGTCISLPLKRIHCKIEGGGLLARGQPPGLPSQLSPMAIDHSSPLQQQGLPQIHTAFPFPFDLFSFFPFTGKTGSTPEYSTPETKCKNILSFYFS